MELREQIAKALYEEDAWPDRDWEELGDSRRVGWLDDADRIIPIVQAYHAPHIAAAQAEIDKLKAALEARGLLSGHDPEMDTQRNAQLEGLAIGLEQRGEKSAAHIIRLALKRLRAPYAKTDASGQDFDTDHGDCNDNEDEDSGIESDEDDTPVSSQERQT